MQLRARQLRMICDRRDLWDGLFRPTVPSLRSLFISRMAIKTLFRYRFCSLDFLLVYLSFLLRKCISSFLLTFPFSLSLSGTYKLVLYPYFNSMDFKSCVLPEMFVLRLLVGKTVAF